MNLRPWLFALLGAALSSCGEATATLDCSVTPTVPVCLVDRDRDGIGDGEDNCAEAANPGQSDVDGDGVGDACEAAGADRDGDGVPDSDDNCPDLANPGQADADGDGAGDACDGLPVSDRDGDGVPDSNDNCPDVLNAGQADADGDGTGDVCEAAPADRDGDGRPDVDDNCPDVANPGQADADGDGAGDACDAPPASDRDGDGVADDRDNCPDVVNPGQADFDGNGQGDACTAQDGSPAHPFIISPPKDHWVFTEERSTADSPSDQIDSYPPNTSNESGKEFVYAFRIARATRFAAEVSAPEPSGVDIDVHLLSSMQPLTLISRSNLAVTATLEPGVYYLSLDSFNGMVGRYVLDVTFRPKVLPASETFNAYILKAVDRIHRDWSLRGYSDAAFTHALPYGGATPLPPGRAPFTMCVAAVTEVMLTAMEIYASETGDSAIFNFLPRGSWASLAGGNIRAHLWVNPDLGAGGSGDAFRHFGMGQTVPFEQLTPGSFINLNRTTGSGHAVVFLAFLDLSGNEYTTWNSNVVGFKYYSSQGSETSGGFDYRWAVFSEYGSPTMPGKRDSNVIYSTNQTYLNTGMVYAPSKWLRTSWSDPSRSPVPGRAQIVSEFDPVYFDGVTVDD